MEHYPLVSVVMSVYNGAKYLREAIDSILEQTYKNFELIIINDFSSDSTTEILNEYCDVRITILSNSKNLGLASSLNKGIKISRGEYILRMDADDIALPNRIETQVRFMQKNRHIDIAGSAAYYIKNEIETRVVFKVLTNPEKLKARLLWNSIFIHPTVIFRSKSLQGITPLYNEIFKKSQDYELWERLVFDHKLKVANIKKPLLKYRVHSQNISNKFLFEQMDFADKVRARALSRFNITGSKNIEVYINFVRGEKLSRISTIRLTLVLKQLYQSNESQNQLKRWAFNQLPFSTKGTWALSLYFRTRIFLIFPIHKRLTFIARSLYSALIAVQN